ncbi:FAD-dependent oxidoreductase [Oxalobacteraceae bacterium CAVE-383]|nr:FAD-dependent oxidoreductase [Oxalobacteraceae bacterium CAVE-383]
MQICVLGAGVIGVTSAYRLLQDGHSVTLIDAMPEAGSQTSLGNGAQLSYSYVAPLADPSVWTHWPHYLFGADSPLTMRLQADTAQWRWLLRFLGASNRHRARQTTVELLRLAAFSRDSLQQIATALPALEFSHRNAGKLVMYTEPRELHGARAQVDFQAQYGSRQEVLGAARCLEIEPALASSQRRWAGGVYTPDEDVGDCGAFCRGLVAAMRSDPNFRFLSDTRVTGLRLSDGALRTVFAGERQIEADSFVLALGAESAAFARMAGFALPVYPLKGYSITVPLAEAGSTRAKADPAPRVSITDLSRKIVYARLGNRLRVAGRVELVGMDRSIPDRAVRELVMGTVEMFPACRGLSDPARLSPWAGFRPATPTGVPIIDASPVANLYLNVGHGALGWTLACGSASLLGDRIAGRAPAIDDAPFRFDFG